MWNRISHCWLVNQHEHHRSSNINITSKCKRTRRRQQEEQHQPQQEQQRQQQRVDEILGFLNIRHHTCCKPYKSKSAKAEPFNALTHNILPIVKSSYNQIVEVLIVLLLANCLINSLTHLPLKAAAANANVAAAHQTEQFQQLRQDSLVDFLNKRIFSNYFQDVVSATSRSNSEEFTSNDYETPIFDSRKPHSISGSAFGYNGLQMEHNLQEFGSPNSLLRSQNFKISPKPCTVGLIEGTCMFVWECIKSEGRHVGMCVDSFMFGSCCAHNYTDNIILHNTFSYTRPTKPVGMASVNHRPPQHPHRPSISGMTTIERPHGAGTLVIRPSGPHHQGSLMKPQHLKPSYGSTSTLATTTTTIGSPNPLLSLNGLHVDLESSASISSVSAVQQQHWHFSTEPNFITKPRPPSSEKPITLRPKPSKPSKKPLNTTLIWLTMQQQQQQQQLTSPQPPPLIFSNYSTRKPIKLPKPTSSTSATTTITATTVKTSTSAPPSSTSTLTMAATTATLKPKPTVMTQNVKPSKLPSPYNTTRPYSKPTSSTSGSSSSSDSGSNSSDASLFSVPATEAMTNAISSTTITTMTAAAINIKPTKNTQRPITLQSSPSIIGTGSTFSISTTEAQSSGSTSHTLPPFSPSTIETNEITDTVDSKEHIIKTISAARTECGIPVLARPETRIVGGKSAAFGRWPWQVSVRRTSFFGFSSTHRCGGALINENWIATAGHCVDDLLISQIRIRVGEYDFSHVQEQLPYIERSVAKKVVHPQYNFFTYEYDLALVKLEQPLEFAPHVSPICLPQTNSLLIGMNATVTGWGRLSEGGTLPSVLQEVSVPIVSNDNCKSMFLRAGRQEFIPEIFLCAGYETGGQDSCQGDSGGPLQVKSQNGHYFLAGIISWGIGCAEANLPGVCTRISKFVPWIMENVT
uniref:Peptidase S1 domain-containing protein n=1 Tax=Glossina brevipalpis TaxID=37001 RepID=A0A1A9W3V3_9MUSC